jgi:GalNAc-alpha-(1->4)-GalNAc-alpha-(1->3)-diNAcBac-PP-undecaprenol alpha-1,4-N-acetyl-D-galactosaminyltransferase
MQSVSIAATGDATAIRAPRILLVVGGLDCGGAQRVMAGMANYWAAGGWRVQLATWTGPEIPDFYELLPGIERIWLGVRIAGRSPFAVLWASVVRVLKLRRLLQHSKPDAVISFIDVSNIYTIIAAMGLSLHVVVSERTNPSVNATVSRPWRLLRRILYSWASQVVAQTQDAARWIETRCRASVVVIPNALRTLPVRDYRREPLIVAVGRLSAEKGQDVLLRAFSQIRAEFPEWSVQIIGDGPERNALEALCVSLNLSDSVSFLGQVQNVEEWLGRAGLMIHSSRREGFPNAVLEAMGMGAAVICADCPSGPAELIQDGVNGRLVPVGDVAELARVMTELMRRSEVREALGHEAVRVRQQYDPSAIMAKWEACLPLGPGGADHGSR